MSEEEYVAQMHTGALLNPRIDSTFKALFTQPTKESRAALQSFLEAATERSIDSFEFVANDAPEEFFGQRRVSYDIMCVFTDGEAANIEMQAFNQEYDYGKRAEYQVARLETTYLKKGDSWEKAPKVYQITVLDFVYTKPSEDNKESFKPVSRYAMRTKDGRELTNALNVVFIELPKVKKLEDSLETNSKLENWAIFLKDADNPNKTGLIHQLANKEAGLMNAQMSLSNISANRDLWIAQYRKELAERDELSSREAMLKKGLARGIEQGIKQGLEQGLEQGLAQGREQGLVQGIKLGREQGLAQGQMQKARESAKNFLRMGLPAEQVAQGVGLPLEEVLQLL